MARIRTVKPEFWSDEKLKNVPLQARLAFIGLWTYSDDYGVVKGNPVLLKSFIFPYDDNIRQNQFNEWLDALVNARMLQPFIFNGESLYYIRSFRNHQKVDRPSLTRNCPESAIPKEFTEVSMSAPRGLDEGSLLEVVSSSTEVVSSKPSSVEEVIEYFISIKILNPKENAEKFFHFYESKGWMIGKNKIKKWKSCVKSWNLPKEKPLDLTERAKQLAGQ